MGTILTVYDNVSLLYEKYYPKQKWLHPTYVFSIGMLSSIGYKLTSSRGAQMPTHLNNFIFLFSTGANLGIQIWVTFVSGMTMIRLLPRHQFGLVQSHLFPKYAFLTSLFAFGSFSSYLNVNPISAWENEKLILGGLMGTSFILSLINVVYLNPKTIDYNISMHRIEKNAGEGITTVGRLIQESKLENDQEYVETRKKFYTFHGVASLANFISLASTIGQFYLLSANASF